MNGLHFGSSWMFAWFVLFPPTLTKWFWSAVAWQLHLSLSTSFMLPPAACSQAFGVNEHSAFQRLFLSVHVRLIHEHPFFSAALLVLGASVPTATRFRTPSCTFLFGSTNFLIAVASSFLLCFSVRVWQLSDLLVSLVLLSNPKTGGLVELNKLRQSRKKNSISKALVVSRCFNFYIHIYIYIYEYLLWFWCIYWVNKNIFLSHM